MRYWESSTRYTAGASTPAFCTFRMHFTSCTNSSARWHGNGKYRSLPTLCKLPIKLRMPVLLGKAFLDNRRLVLELDLVHPLKMHLRVIQQAQIPLLRLA